MVIEMDFKTPTAEATTLPEEFTIKPVEVSSTP